MGIWLRVVFFFLSSPLLLKLCYDTSSSKRPIAEECMRRDGKLPLARSRSPATSSRAFARRFPFFFYPGQATGWPQSLLPSSFRFFFASLLLLLGSESEGAVCLSGKDVCSPPHFWDAMWHSHCSDDPPCPRSSGPSNQPFSSSNLFIFVFLIIWRERD